MPVPRLNTSVLASVTGLPEGNLDAVLGAEDDALREARGVLGAEAWALVNADGGVTALADAATEAEMQGAVQRAVARLAFALVAPTMGAVRPTTKGGFQMATGTDQNRTEMMSVGAVQRLADRMASQARAALASVREDAAALSATDDVEAPAPVWFA